MKLTALQKAQSSIKGFPNFYDKMIMKMSLAGLSKSTITNYIRHLAQVSLYHQKVPSILSADQIEDYFYYLQKTYTAPSNTLFKLTIAALRFAFKALHLKKLELNIPSIKRPVKLPVVLNKAEIKDMLNIPLLLKHRLLIAILYGCGLRCGELCNIMLSDIDLQRSMLHIR